MFGYVTVSWKELTREQQKRYSSVYCGICRELGRRCSSPAKVCLSYDMVFLALLQMSLYEPAETEGRQFCAMHPLHPKHWTDTDCIAYAADMNAALAWYKAKDDQQDDHSRKGRLVDWLLASHQERIAAAWPRQCAAIESCIRELNQLEAEGCPNPDIPAGCFGRLMAELLVMQEDCWQEPLRTLGDALGRFVYLIDAQDDYDRDAKKGSYNPYLAAHTGKDAAAWEQHLVLAMARAAQSYEKLPLVQDKALLDNILYSGVWVRRRPEKKEESHG